MILVIDCTRQDLPILRDEFVTPVMTIVMQAGYETCSQPLASEIIPENLQAVILTGTALKDDEFLKSGLPQWLISWTGPVLGICAGMQLIAISAGGEIIPGEKIGMAEISVTGEDPVFFGKTRFNAWELHRSGVIVPDTTTVLAISPSGVQAIRRADRPWYGLLFHPEVRNEWVILNFLNVYTQR